MRITNQTTSIFKTIMTCDECGRVFTGKHALTVKMIKLHKKKTHNETNTLHFAPPTSMWTNSSGSISGRSNKQMEEEKIRCI